jgi:hypothetical protein
MTAGIRCPLFAVVLGPVGLWSGAFGVLYLGLSLDVALAETLLRNPARKMVSFPAIAVPLR